VLESRPVAAIGSIFLDFDGVLNDNSAVRPKWADLVGQFFEPRLGGTEARWGEANLAIIDGVLARETARFERWEAGRDDFFEEVRQYRTDWLRSMCAAAGVDGPASDDECGALADEAQRWILPQVQKSFPGNEAVLKELALRHRLFTASGWVSPELATCLSRWGSHHLFTRLYGPDLVSLPKLGPVFYTRIFEDAGIDPTTALVVDDTPRCVIWAQEAGAQAVLVSRDGVSPEGATTIRSLAELPELLKRL